MGTGWLVRRTAVRRWGGRWCRGGRTGTIRNRRHRSGIALAWTAVVLFVMIAMVGLSIDWGKAVWNVHQLQNAADAAALAGAQVVKYNYSDPFDPGGARNWAIALAQANIADQRSVSLDRNPTNAVDGEIVLGRWIRQERLFVPTMLSPSAVKVVGRRLGQRDDAPPLALIFGPIFGTSEARMSRMAIGWSRGSTGAGILQLSSDPQAEGFPGWHYKSSGLVAGGGSEIDLYGRHWQTGEPILGDIQIDSESVDPTWPAFRINGNSADIRAGDLNICGTSRPDPDSDWSDYYMDGVTEEYWVSVNPGEDRVEDPLLDVEAPVLSEMPTFTEKIDDQFIRKAYDDGDPRASYDADQGIYRYELSPGYYSGGIEIGKVPGQQTQVVLEGGLGGGRSGVFAFGGTGVVIGGNSSVVEKDPPVNTVTGQPFDPRFNPNRGVLLYITGTGSLTMHGNAYLQISPRGDWLNERVVDGEMGISIWQDREDHNQAVITGGANYFVSGTVYMGYNAVKVTGNTNNLGTQFIVGALEIDGGLRVGIGYDGRNQYDIRGAFLVR